MIQRVFILLIFIQLSYLSHAQWESVHLPNYITNDSIPELYEISFSTPLKGMGLTANSSNTLGAIMRTYDGGETWDTCYTAINPMQYNIFHIDSSLFFAILNNFKLLRTHNFGNTWDTVPLASIAYLFDFPNPALGYYFSNGGIYQSLDSGSSWSLINQYSIYNAWDMDFVNDSLGIINTIDTIYRTIDSGQTWTSVFSVSFPQPPIIGVEFPSIFSAYAMLFDPMSATNVQIYKSINTGISWQFKSNTPVMVDNIEMEFPSDSIGYLSGSYSIVKTNNGGDNWDRQYSAGTGKSLNSFGFYDLIYSLDFINDTVGFCAGYDSEFHRTTNGGEIIDGIKGLILGSFLIEGCTAGSIYFWIANPRQDTVVFNIEKLGGTASDSIDFFGIPDSVLILPGDSFANVSFSTIKDTITEGVETFTLVIPNYYQDTLTFSIIDSNYIQVNLSATTTNSCNGSTLELSASTQLFYPFLNYSWSPFFKIFVTNDGETATAYPDTSEWYKVFISDYLGGCINNSDSIFINYGNSSLNVILDTICQNDSLLFSGQYLKASGFYKDTLSSVLGCDSVIMLSLNVIPLPQVHINTFPSDSICLDVFYVPLPYATPMGGIYTGSGVNKPNFFPQNAGLGSHWINYSYEDLFGCRNSDSTSITVLDCTSILNLSDTIRIETYPNPASQYIVIQSNVDCQIRLLNLLGNSILEDIIIAYQAKKIDVKSIPKGIYFLEFNVSGQIGSKKIIIQ